MSSLNRLLIILLLLGGAIIVFDRVGWLQPIEGGVHALMSPVQRFLAHAFPAQSHTVQNPKASTVVALQDKVARLTAENIRLRADAASRNAAAKQKNFLTLHGWNGETADVIGRSPDGDQYVAILDRGSELGIAAGQAVVTEDGVFVGKIQDARRGRSTLLLLTSAQISVAAQIDNAKRSNGIVSGEHGLTLRMKLIPQDEQIAVGQAVVTSSVDEHTPENLLIGVITDIQYKTGDLFQQAILEPMFDPQHIRTVTIITR